MDADAPCKTCNDTGSFIWRYGPGPETDEYKCDCDSQRAANLTLANSGVWDNFRRSSWWDIHAIEREVVGPVEGYLESAQACIDRGVSFLFHGGNGRGKSMLAVLMAKHVLGLGFDAYVTSFYDMMELYTSGWRSDEDRAYFQRRVMQSDFLVLDDIGRERVGKAEMVSEIMEMILRHRVACALPMVITTNLDPKQLGTRYGGAAMSLMHEMATVLKFNSGEDYRNRDETNRLTAVFSGLSRPIEIMHPDLVVP